MMISFLELMMLTIAVLVGSTILWYQRRHCENMVHKKQNQITSLEERIEELQNENEELKKSEATSKENSEDMRIIREKFEEGLQEAVEERNKAVSECENLKNQLDDLHQSYERLKESEENFKSNAESMRLDREKLDQYLEEVSDERIKAVSECELLRDQLNSSQQECYLLKESETVKNSSLEAMRLDRGKHEQDLKRITEERNKAVNESENLKNQLGDLHQSFEHLKESEATFKSNAEAMHTVCEKLEQDLEEVAGERIKAVSECVLLKDQLNNLQQECYLLKESETAKNSSLEAMRLDRGKLEQDLKRVSEERNKAASECENLKDQLQQNDARFTQEYEAVKEKKRAVENKLGNFEDSHQKLKEYCRKLNDDMKTKEEEILKLSSEIEKKETLMTTLYDSEEMNKLKKMVQNANQEARKNAEKAKQLQLHLSECSIQLEEKEQTLLRVQKLYNDLSAENETIVGEVDHLREELAKASTPLAATPAISLKNLQEPTFSSSQQFVMLKQAFLKMILDEDHAYDHSLVVISLLDYDSKSKEVLNEYVVHKYQGSLDHFWQKFKAGELAQQLSDFVDEEIAKSEVIVSAANEPEMKEAVPASPLPSPEDHDLHNII